MATYDHNPFREKDADREAIWDMLVCRDIDAYLAVDWEAVVDDFVAEEFFGIDAGHSRDVDSWKPLFPTLDAYRDAWIDQARETRVLGGLEKIRAALFSLTTLSQIDINGDFAIAHKKFDGAVPNKEGGTTYLNWQTLYYCKKVAGVWKIRGFNGYMPNPLNAETKGPAKLVPPSEQHVTAGPYSPVLRVPAGSELIVISGQAPIDLEGNVVGDTIEEQTRYTLSNCETQLRAAGASLADVFKVNVYLKDIQEWDRFNGIYAEIMPLPYPVRTAIEAYLPVVGFHVEIEMWAARR